MREYRITFARSARRELEQLPRILVERILAKIGSLMDNPRPRGCRKLQGPSQLWRIRIGDYRIIYSINDEKRIVDIAVIRHRSEAYR